VLTKFVVMFRAGSRHVTTCDVIRAPSWIQTPEFHQSVYDSLALTMSRQMVMSLVESMAER